ncbi:LysM peptidoglycan-binding domain-containing protein [Peptococcaceae bacterium 1198_IL3148]
MLKQRGFIKVTLCSTLITGLLFFSSHFADAGQTYTVIPGDSLWKISQKYNISINQLKKLNNLTSDEIWVGQKLAVAVDTNNSASNSNTYTVQRGDSLYLIAKAHGISVSDLKAANNLAANEILVGQQLTIPNSKATVDNPQNQKYTVVPGDSLYFIAKRFGTTVDNLMNVNQLTSDSIYVGQQLIISANSQSSTPTPKPPATTPDKVSWQIPTGVNLYYVKSGDSLSGIAQKYGSSVNAIIKTNNMKSQLITPGMPLFVPNSQNPVSISAPKGPQKTGYGELLPWEFANWFFNHESTGVIKDLATGTTFKIKRIGGGNHADCEPLTASDTAIMKGLYGGSWSWQTRPVILEYQGRQIAASMAGMPHSFDSIAGNNFDGMFDLHFLHSRTHNTNSEDPKHQEAVKKAAGN